MVQTIADSDWKHITTAGARGHHARVRLKQLIEKCAIAESFTADYIAEWAGGVLREMDSCGFLGKISEDVEGENDHAETE